jgi:hypothetical protein
LWPQLRQVLACSVAAAQSRHCRTLQQVHVVHFVNGLGSLHALQRQELAAAPAIIIMPVIENGSIIALSFPVAMV